jgi:predicted GH43/DUF377 family glycosyl hydrolase
MQLPIMRTLFTLFAAAWLPAGGGCRNDPQPVPAAEPAAPLPFPPGLMAQASEVAPADMQRVYEEIRTPFKYGVVLPAGEGEKLDCPNVFRHDGRWYMVFAVIRDNVGYETHLAVSDDLLHWERLGAILPFDDNQGWDKWQAAGGLALFDTEWGGSNTIQTHDGRYWMTYLGGALQGYETDPLSAGLAWTTAPGKPSPWTRHPDNPVLTRDQPGARCFEAGTVYKSHVIHDPAETLGFPFVMFYNGKQRGGNGHEAIGMAVSRDMRQWRRLGDSHVIYNKGESRWAISGDPQITRIGDLWVMFYFGAFWKPNAFDTFACSHDLVNWTKWDGPHLVEPSEPWDRQFAHKPWIIRHAGVVYHFYCAVGDQGRVIALATSQDQRPGD